MLSLGKEDDAAAEEAQMARQAEAKRQANIRTGTDRINSIFADSFKEDTFDGIRDNYSKYAMPDVERQFKDAQNDLTFALTNAGMLDSSVRADKESDLLRQRDEAIRGVGQKSLDYENEARTNIEAARADLIKTLNATGDVDAAVTDALS